MYHEKDKDISTPSIYICIGSKKVDPHIMVPAISASFVHSVIGSSGMPHIHEVMKNRVAEFVR